MPHPHDTRYCREYAAPITEYARQARFCSVQCRRTARNRYQRDKRNSRPHTGTCELCGESFTASAQAPRQRFCSTRCRSRLYLRHHRWATKRRSVLRGPAWWDSKPTTVEVGAYYDGLRLDPCAYCGDTGGETDHIVSRAQGGPNEWQNYTGACRTCNSSKSSLSMLHAMLAMRIQRDIGPALDQLGLIRGIEVRQWRTYASVSPKAH